MSMNDLFGTGGAKPKLITAYTSGTGTYVPTENNARCLVRIQAGGAGGYSGGSGGGGGAMVEVFVRVPIAGLAYAVGAGGAVGANGSVSTFDVYTAMGGVCDVSGSNTAMYGGFLSILLGGVSATAAGIFGGQGLPGVPGGSGGNSTMPGKVAGFPTANSAQSVASAYLYAVGNGQGNNSGGNSFYGKGGTTGNAPAAGAYGAGGGNNAAGAGGCIEIWDMGA